MKRLFLILGLLVISNVSYSQRVIDLSGEWQFEIDRHDAGMSQGWQTRSLSDRIILPASMPERKKGDDISIDTKWVGSLYDSSYFYNPYMERYRQPGKMKLTFFLTPDKHYVGVAWYNKSIKLDSVNPRGKRYIVYLERPHIQTTLYVNGKKVGSDSSLCVAHEYDVTNYLKHGENLLSIRIDNRPETVNVGQDSHSITDQTQGDWNGIVGKMELRELPALRITDLQVYPEIDSHSAKVVLQLSDTPKKKSKVLLFAELFNTFKTHNVSGEFDCSNLSSDNKLTVNLDMGDGMQLWDEFHPNLYRLSAIILDNKTGISNKFIPNDIKDMAGSFETVFGMRKIEIRGKMFYVNGHEIQLRGTVENCDFPLTGYAPMDLESWKSVFRICKSYGLNHMRFHSYCPPEAAFMAADLMGFYIQPEGPSWPNHGVRLGYGDDIDTYLLEETQRLTKAYGNHPSFCMLACGNEPAGRWVEWVGKFVDYWKSADPRRVYTGASVGGGWAWQPKSQYHVKAGARGLAEWQRHAPNTLDDFNANITHYKGRDLETDINEPYVSHETGQWCAFPDLSETDQYTGVYKARNFEVFHDILNDHHMGDMGHKFLMASGKLQTLCYKYEIERTLRTNDYAGFQLLALNDYSGQGTALVGLTNVFFKDKGYITADQFRHFCSPVVPLARIPKFTYTNKETFRAEILLNQFSEDTLKDIEFRWTLSQAPDEPYISFLRSKKLEDSNDNLIIDEIRPQYISPKEIKLDEGTFARRDYPIGDNQAVGKVEIPLNRFDKPTHLRLRVHTIGTKAMNEWDFWVYPENVDMTEAGLFITDSLDSEALKVLSEGGDVLITAGQNVKYGKEVVQYFTPVFWNTSWFKMRPPHTTGIYVDNNHSIFTDFPTDYYSNLQWWELVNKAPVMQFDEFPSDFQPLVQSIDTWFLSRKIGMLFESNVLNGRLIMTTMDISTDLEHRIVARQMRASILNYMHSDKFKPKYRLDPKVIEHLFTKEAPKVDMFTKNSPDELKPKIK